MPKPGCLGDRPLKRNELGQVIRQDGKVDLRSLRPRDTINTSGLKPGIEGLRDTRDLRERQKSELMERLKQPDGLKELLREIAVDKEQSGSYRVSAVNALADLDADDKKGGLCWKCNAATDSIPKSVQEWIDSV